MIKPVIMQYIKMLYLAVQGPMTTDSIGTNPTPSGLGFDYRTYEDRMVLNMLDFQFVLVKILCRNQARIESVPGEIGTVLFYNKALSYEEVLINYNSMRGRYGL
jgi:hypothetical protein